MAARGALAKQTIFDTMLKTFEGSFMYNGGKELRIPFTENGEVIEIKVTLTAAKDVVGNGSGFSGSDEGAAVASEMASSNSFPTPRDTNIEPSDEEKANVQKLLESLGLN